MITTNVDHCFQKAGFDKKRLFYTQGDYGLFQCSEPCHSKTYENENMIREMVLSQGYASRSIRLRGVYFCKCITAKTLLENAVCDG